MSLDPELVNFSVWKGATFRRVLFLKDQETEEPLDLDGYTSRLVIYGKDRAVLHELSTDDGITLNDPEGAISLYFSDEDTEAAQWSSGKYKLLLTTPSGETDVLLHGRFLIREDV